MFPAEGTAGLRPQGGGGFGSSRESEEKSRGQHGCFECVWWRGGGEAARRDIPGGPSVSGSSLILLS